MAARRLRVAVSASLLLHLLALWPTGMPLPSRDTPAVFRATLLPQPGVPAQAASSRHTAHIAPPQRVPAATQGPTETRPPAPVPLAREPEPTPTQSMRMPSLVHDPATRADPAAKGLPVPAPAPMTVPLAGSPGAGGNPGGVPMTEGSAVGEAMDGLRAYRLAVASHARQFKRYPAQAIAASWEGVAQIRVEVGRDGTVRPATVVHSSGHETLDQAALAMINAGALRSRLPESLRGRVFAVVLPVLFNMNDE